MDVPPGHFYYGFIEKKIPKYGGSVDLNRRNRDKGRHLGTSMINKKITEDKRRNAKMARLLKN